MAYRLRPPLRGGPTTATTGGVPSSRASAPSRWRRPGTVAHVTTTTAAAWLSWAATHDVGVLSTCPSSQPTSRTVSVVFSAAGVVGRRARWPARRSSAAAARRRGCPAPTLKDARPVRRCSRRPTPMMSPSCTRPPVRRCSRRSPMPAQTWWHRRRSRTAPPAAPARRHWGSTTARSVPHEADRSRCALDRLAELARLHRMPRPFQLGNRHRRPPVHCCRHDACFLGVGAAERVRHADQLRCSPSGRPWPA